MILKFFIGQFIDNILKYKYFFIANRPLFLLLICGIITLGCSGGGFDLSRFDLEKGEQIYNNTCIACHLAGMSGSAPKVGKKNEWVPRIAQGLETLFNNSLTGLNDMPAKGGDVNLSDEDLKNAVAFMVSKSW